MLRVRCCYDFMPLLDRTRCLAFALGAESTYRTGKLKLPWRGFQVESGNRGIHEHSTGAIALLTTCF